MEGSLRWSRFAGRTCERVGNACFSSGFLKDCILWKGPTLKKFLKNCGSWEGSMLEKFMKGCIPWEGHLAQAGEEHEKEGASETRDELAANPTPHPPVMLRGR